MKRDNIQFITLIFMMVLIMIGVGITRPSAMRQLPDIMILNEFVSPQEQYIELSNAVVISHEKELEAIRLAEEEAIAAASVVNLQNINRNFNVFVPTNLSEEDLYRALKGPRSGLYDIVPAVVEAEDKYGVNALYLLATLGGESGWGKHETGANNIAGWKTIKGGWRNFNSRYDCVMTVADRLYNSFLPDVGSTLGGVTWRYCRDDGYADMIMRIMNDLQNNMRC